MSALYFVHSVSQNTVRARRENGKAVGPVHIEGRRGGTHMDFESQNYVNESAKTFLYSHRFNRESLNIYK
jgi:hypothetical protein